MTLREFRLPDLGEGLTESDVVAWRVGVGDRVSLNQVIADVETAKALVELPAPCAGVVTALHAEEGQTVAVGAPLVTFEVEAPAAAPADDGADAEDAPPPNLVGYGARAEQGGRPVRRRARTAAPAESVPAPRGARKPSSPPVRVLARRLGVDLESLDGSGPDGLVVRADVEAAARSAAPRASAEERIPIRGVRKHTAAAMVRSAFTAPHVTEFLTLDVTPSVDLLAHLRDDPRVAGVRVTLLALVAHAVCDALGRHPDLNASWDEEAQQIVRHGHVHLGIAAATERGLVVPHIPDAGSLPLLGLAAALGELTETARASRTAPELLRGGTFTITNIGVFGIDAGTPILTPGEAGILAVGAVRRMPWEHRGEIALRDVVTLSLSFDHRLVDGEQASRFLVDVGALLAEPGLALLAEGRS